VADFCHNVVEWRAVMAMEWYSDGLRDPYPHRHSKTSSIEGYCMEGGKTLSMVQAANRECDGLNMYKISRYNHFQPWSDGYHLAFNAVSGAVALMTAENYALYKDLARRLTDGSNQVFSPQEQELLNQLKYGKFIHPDYYDELEELKFMHRSSRFERTALGLVLAPTMACNMACVYCFEGNKKGIMSAGVIENLIKFVENQARHLRELNVSWYGGEPLLAMGVIEDLTETFLDMGQEHDFDYTASMISNGYLLTKENVDRLRKLKVETVQVTLDGPSHVHNRKRPLKNGKESFHTIVENAAYASTKMQVSIRVNIDRSFTEDMIVQLLEELKPAGLRQRVGINFGRIEAATSACASISDDCLGTSDFSEVEKAYYRLLFEHGFMVGKLPQPTATVCMSQLTNSFLIDHEGRHYRCFNYVGDESKAAGNIKDAIDYNNPRFTDLFAFDPFEDEMCRNCNILPICMGGCPARRFEGKVNKEELCDSWKHNLKPMLETIALARQQQMQSATKEQS
jgi:uncharacterized protein